MGHAAPLSFTSLPETGREANRPVNVEAVWPGHRGGAAQFPGGRITGVTASGPLISADWDETGADGGCSDLQNAGGDVTSSTTEREQKNIIPSLMVGETDRGALAVGLRVEVERAKRGRRKRKRRKGCNIVRKC